MKICKYKSFGLFILILIALVINLIDNNNFKDTRKHHFGYKSHSVYNFPISIQSNYKDYVYLRDAFTKEECENIINLGNNLIKKQATISQNKIYNPEIRDSKISWIEYNSETEWLFNKIAKIILDANDKYYHFDLSGIYEKLQFTEYNAPAGHYNWHTDSGQNTISTRKLSLVIQLSNAEDYEGGALEIFPYSVDTIKKKQGAATIFPSYNNHRVTPIVKGKRYSLVVWVNGPSFR